MKKKKKKKKDVLLMNQLTKITDKLDNQGQTIQNLTEKLDKAGSTISDLTRTIEDNKCFRSIYAFTEPKHVGNKRLTWRANNFFNHMRKIGRFMEMPENVFKSNFECNFKEMSKYFNIFLHSANLRADGKFFEATKFLEEDGGIAGLDYIERKGKEDLFASKCQGMHKLQSFNKCTRIQKRI
jgi:hypothetical protein